MPTGVYLRTEEYRKIMSKAMTGKKKDKSCREKIRLKRLGIKLSEETKRKISLNNVRYWLGKKRPDISLSMKGRTFSKETRMKLSLAHKGKKKNYSWNRGKKGLQKCPWKGKKLPYCTGEKHWAWKGGISKHRLYKRFHCIKRKLLTGDLSLNKIQQVYEDNIKQYGTLTCYLCLQSIPFGQDCIEHKIPLSRGGTNSRDNLDIAHRGCNNRKYNKTEEEFRLERSTK